MGLAQLIMKTLQHENGCLLPRVVKIPYEVTNLILHEDQDREVLSLFCRWLKILFSEPDCHLRSHKMTAPNRMVLTVVYKIIRMSTLSGDGK